MRAPDDKNKSTRRIISISNTWSDRLTRGVDIVIIHSMHHSHATENRKYAYATHITYSRYRTCIKGPVLHCTNNNTLYYRHKS